MSFVLIVFLSLYGLMHFYLYLKATAAFAAMGKWRLVLILFLLAMVIAPIVAVWLERARHFRAAKGLALVGFPWMAALFWFCVLALALDLWNLAVRGVALAAPSARVAAVSPRAGLLAIAVLVVAALCWGFYEAGDIRLHRLTVDVPHLPDGRQSLTLVQITDLHLGTHIDRRRFARVLDLVREARPDVIVSTGDLVDSPLENIEPLAAPLNELARALGKFAVLGNHEYYAGLDQSLKFHEAAGFQVLRGQSVSLGQGLRVVGVDDPAGERMDGPCFDRDGEALASGLQGPETEAQVTTIFLKHQPRVSDESRGRFRVQLSGHTHGGQIFPFMAVTRLYYQYYRGEYDLPDGSLLYVNLGAGTWGPPLRLFAPPEVAVITLQIKP